MMAVVLDERVSVIVVPRQVRVVIGMTNPYDQISG